MVDMVGNQTIRTLWRDVMVDHADDTFLIFDSIEGEISQFTYQACYDRINQASHAFAQLGVEKGDRVLVHLCNSPEFLFCWFGLAQIGAVIVPVNVANKVAECQFILDKSQPKVAVVSQSYLEQYPCSQGHKPEHILVARNQEPISDYAGFLELLDQQPTTPPPEIPLSSDDLMEILFTSGTTSFPKGVMMTHCNAIYAGMIHAWQCDLEKGERFFTTMPCFHIDFQLMAVMSVLIAGGTLVVGEHFSARRFWNQVYTHRANVIDTMPLLIRTAMAQPVQPWEKDHCVHHCYFSMGMSTEEKEAFESRFGVRILNCYGSTETVSCVTGDPQYGPRRWPSVGRTAPSYAIRIVDELGVEVPCGEEGEIEVLGTPGRSLMLGYYDEPEITASILSPEGWFHTGDKGYLDEEGWLYFLDRDVNMIKRSGENISTTEVENVLTAHPEIEEAAVFGVPDPMYNQIVKAVVRLVAESQLTPDEIICYCASGLSAFKIPAVVEICQDFPRTCTGKIQKKKLQ